MLLCCTKRFLFLLNASNNPDGFSCEVTVPSACGVDALPGKGLWEQTGLASLLTHGWCPRLHPPCPTKAIASYLGEPFATLTSYGSSCWLIFVWCLGLSLEPGGCGLLLHHAFIPSVPPRCLALKCMCRCMGTDFLALLIRLKTKA